MHSAVIRPARTAASRYRWTVCALLFFATVINYMDRQILGLLAPVLQHDIGWTQVQYGRIVIAFSAFYAVGLLCFGRIVDWLGTRISYALAMLIWSMAAVLHAAVGSVAGFAIVRALLGIGEGVTFRLPSRRRQNGSRGASVRLRPASSTLARISAQCSRPQSSRRLRWRSAGVRRS